MVKRKTGIDGGGGAPFVIVLILILLIFIVLFCLSAHLTLLLYQNGCAYHTVLVFQWAHRPSFLSPLSKFLYTVMCNICV